MKNSWYEKVYHQIIDKRKKEMPEGYVEHHHIVPKSLGGSNDKENLVALTAREHYICHHLLMRMYYDPSHITNEYYRMCYAFDAMSKFNNNGLRKTRVNSRTFEILKKEIARCNSVFKSGENAPNYGKIAIYNKELNLSKFIRSSDEIPDGWIKGGKPLENPVWLGKHHSEDTKEKLRLIHATKHLQSGEKNSQYGKKWMFNLELQQNKKFHKNDCLQMVNEGWHFGRVNDFKRPQFLKYIRGIKFFINNDSNLKDILLKDIEAQKQLNELYYPLEKIKPLNKKPKSPQCFSREILLTETKQWLIDNNFDLNKFYKNKIIYEYERKRLLEKRRYYTYLHKIYREIGFNKMKEQTNYPFTEPNFVQNLARYVDDFIPQNGKKRGK